MASWESGYPSDCKSAYTSSILVEASRFKNSCSQFAELQADMWQPCTEQPNICVSILQHFQKNVPENQSVIETTRKQPHIRLGVADIWLV